MRSSNSQFRKQHSTSGSNLPNLAYLAHIRRNVSKVKSQNPSLVKTELQCHRASVMEYSSSLLNHLIHLEEEPGSIRLNLQSFEAQPQINEKMRFLIIDFIMCCHARLKLSTSTLFLTFDIMNRYASKFIIKCGNYQLLALSALWISSKYWDSKYNIPNFNILTSLCCQQYTPAQFREIEWHLLTALNWSVLNTPTPDYFIDLLLVLEDKKNVSPIALQHGINNIDEINVASVLLCELAAFDIKLSFNYNASAIALAAITISTLALNFYDFNQWENFREESKDANVVKICDALLKLSIDRDSLPSSFKCKYLNEQDNAHLVGKKIMEALSNYNVQLQLEEFYCSQEFKNLSKSFSNDLIVNENYSEQIIHSSNEIMTNNQGQYYLGKENRGNINPSPSTSSYNSSSSIAFASPNDFFALPTSETTSMMSSEKESLSTTSTLLSNALFYLPLTPTTPTLLQNDSKFIGKRRSIIGNNSSMTARARSTSTSDIIASTGTSSFVKGHFKRSSSSMDIDFFSSDMEVKRNHSRV